MSTVPKRKAKRTEVIILPTDITKCTETGRETASFGYYDGIHVAKKRKLKQTTSFADVITSTHYIVCCGDVMLRVQPEEYPNIKRRPL